MILCFDVGGTFIKYGVIKNKEFIFKDKCSTPDGSKIIDCMKLIYDDAIKNYKINGIGVSSAGQINPNEGSIIFAGPTIPNYTGAKIKSELKKYTSLNVVVYNDITSCINYKEDNIGLYITLGTGIGGALNLKSGPYVGSNYRELEVGHMLVGDKRFEEICSASALIRRVSKLIKRDINGYEIALLFDQKNDIVINEVYNYLDDLVIGLINMILVLDPPCVIIGGGISKASFFDIDYIKKQIITKLNGASGIDTLEIKVSEVYNDAGMIGIYNLFKKEYNEY